MNSTQVTAIAAVAPVAAVAATKTRIRSKFAKIECPCGKSLVPAYRSLHEAGIRHITWLKTQAKPVITPTPTINNFPTSAQAPSDPFGFGGLFNDMPCSKPTSAEDNASSILAAFFQDLPAVAPPIETKTIECSSCRVRQTPDHFDTKKVGDATLPNKTCRTCLDLANKRNNAKIESERIRDTRRYRRNIIAYAAMMDNPAALAECLAFIAARFGPLPQNLKTEELIAGTPVYASCGIPDKAIEASNAPHATRSTPLQIGNPVA